MIQKELAEKFDYNNNKMNKYKFIIKFCTNYRMLFNVSNKVFYPKPKVNSKVQRLVDGLTINIDKSFDTGPGKHHKVSFNFSKEDQAPKHGIYDNNFLTREQKRYLNK